MSRHCYVETLPDGRQKVVTIKRSKSYHHHHHHRSYEYYQVRRDEWSNLVERCRLLEDSNRAFAKDNDALRSSLSASKSEAQRLTETTSQLQIQNSTLHADNQALRRSLETVGDHSASHRDAEWLRRKIEKLEKENKEVKDENADLRFRVYELSKQAGHGVDRKMSDLKRDVEYWKDQSIAWRKKYEDLWARYTSLSGILDSRTQKVEAYEDILKRRGIL